MQLTPILLTLMISLSLASPVAEAEPLALANPEALPIADPEPQGDRNRGWRCRSSRRVSARSCLRCGDQGWYSSNQWYGMQCSTQWQGSTWYRGNDGRYSRSRDWGNCEGNSRRC
ncbi:hypothetical protein BZA77DRAFT_389907 [Pyronema omphalodes]|nr:hypothetical protein BZA77DRAFT_389907 [Pyronema omphalodes]